VRYFRLIESGVPTEPFLAEIASVREAWSSATGRQEKIAVQREAMAIPLRGVRKSAIGELKRRDVHKSRWTSTSEPYVHARNFLKAFAVRQGAELGRAKLVMLPAGRRVYPHIDRGEYYRVRDRYHLVIKSTAGSWLRAGDEEVTMQEGELWWFDNKAMHEAWNHGDQDRLHLIFDMLSATGAAAAAPSSHAAGLT
jgi:aspartyl/asparaginyl beta-hydroxylase (cupin superfamily)